MAISKSYCFHQQDEVCGVVGEVGGVICWVVCRIISKVISGVFSGVVGGVRRSAPSPATEPVRRLGAATLLLTVASGCYTNHLMLSKFDQDADDEDNVHGNKNDIWAGLFSKVDSYDWHQNGMTTSSTCGSNWAGGIFPTAPVTMCWLFINCAYFTPLLVVAVQLVRHIQLISQ